MKIQKPDGLIEIVGRQYRRTGVKSVLACLIGFMIGVEISLFTFHIQESRRIDSLQKRVEQLESKK